MNNHWPILVGVLMIATAAGIGYWQREETIAAAVPKSLQAPSDAPAVATGPQNNAPAPVLVNTPAPTTAQPKPAAATPTPAVTQPAPATPAQPIPKTKRTFTQPSAAPEAVQPAQPTPPQPAQPVQPAQPAVPAAQPAQPAQPKVEAPADPTLQQKAQILLDLKAELQNKLGMLSQPLAGGGYAYSMTGARAEVQPAPNWTISIFNINPQTPEAETDAFKRIFEAISKGLEIDMTQPAVDTVNQKKFMKTTSKLGSVSLVRDLANGNSATIRPIQFTAPRAQPAVPVGAPAQPVAPPPAVPPPPKDPKAAPDGNF